MVDERDSVYPGYKKGDYYVQIDQKCFEVLNCIHFPSTTVGSIFSAPKLPRSYA
jgi:hypothetical protein